MESNESQLFCNKCNGNYVPHEGVTCIKYDFYQCNSCQQVAFNCSTCQKMVSYHRIRCYKRHIASFLHTSSSGSKLPNNDHISECTEFSNSEIFVINKVIEVSPSPNDLSDLCFKSNNVKRFFMHESLRMGNGIKALISDAIRSKIGTGCELVCHNISMLHWAVMCLCHNLKRTKRILLLNVFKQLGICFPKSFGTYSLLPTTEKDMRRLYIDGRYSVRKNLPIPSLQSLDRMTFINFGDIITDFFTICKHDKSEFNHTKIRKNYWT